MVAGSAARVASHRNNALPALSGAHLSVTGNQLVLTCTDNDLSVRFELPVGGVADGVAVDKLYPLDVDRALKSLDKIKDHCLWYDTNAQAVQYLQDEQGVLGLVADGRDMASVVFPDAALKVFLTASAESRAERRYKQLIEKGFSANLDGLLRDLRARDARDAGRTHAPLIAAEGAVVVDSTFLSVEQTVQTVLDGWHAAGLARSRAVSGS